MKNNKFLFNLMEAPQDSILNEFLEKIKELERKNEVLRERILRKNEEIIKLDNDKMNLKLEEKKDEIIIPKKLPTDAEDEIEAKKSLQNYKNIKSNRLEIENNTIEYIIVFNTQEHYNSLYIMGDFTKWELTQMEKIKDNFTYKVILLKGFKYYYSFQAGDEILIDYNSIYEENPRTFQIQNCIDLCQNNKEIIFDFKNHTNLLKAAEKNYFLSELNIKDEEFIFLIQLKNRGELIKKLTKENREKYNKISSSINFYFDELYYSIGSQGLGKKINNFKFYFKNKILVQNNFKEKKISDLIYYRIHDLTQDFIFLCEKLYDDNHIKINNDYYTHNIFYNYIPPNQISLSPIKPESKIYHLLSLEESQKFLENYIKDDKTIIKAYFKTLFNLKNPNLTELIFDDYYLSRNIFLVKPKKIEPEGINMDDYDFYYSYNKITKVRNKKERIDVQFIVIDESVEKSKRPNRLEIYYGIKDKKIYFIHCHVLDKDLRNVKMIIKEIEKNIDPHLLKKSEEYIKNNELLLIVQESIPIKLYYKGKKVKMNSIKIEENKIYLLRTPNIDSFFNNMYVKVTNFDKKLNYDLVEQCNEFSYSLDNISNIQNGVDVQVVFDNQKNFVSEEMMLAVTPCLLKPITTYEENVFRQKMPNIITNSNNDKIQKYMEIKQKFFEIKENNIDKMDKLTKEEKDKIILELNEYTKSLENLLEYFEENELWDNIDEAANVAADIIYFISYLIIQ